MKITRICFNTVISDGSGSEEVVDQITVGYKHYRGEVTEIREAPDHTAFDIIFFSGHVWRVFKVIEVFYERP